MLAYEFYFIFLAGVILGGLELGCDGGLLSAVVAVRCVVGYELIIYYEIYYKLRLRCSSKSSLKR